jgi:ABC-type glutathione transport system ATPase component
MEDVGLTPVCHSLVGDVHGHGNVADSGSSGAKSISGGQRRRLSIAVELLSNPSAIMLDEVRSLLDGRFLLLFFLSRLLGSMLLVL